MVGFELSSFEIMIMKRIWKRLNLMEVEKVKKKPLIEVQNFVKGKDREKKIDMQPHITVRELNLSKFESILCYYLILHEKSLDGSRENSMLQYVDIKTIKERFQISTFISLLYLILNCLEFNSQIPQETLMRIGNINSRIWNLTVLSYKMLGEGIIATISELLPNEFSVEDEFIYIRFHSMLSNIILSYGYDRRIEIYSNIDSKVKGAGEHIYMNKSLLPLLHYPGNYILQKESYKEEQTMGSGDTLNVVIEGNEYSSESSEDEAAYDYINCYGQDEGGPQKIEKEISLVKFTKLTNEAASNHLLSQINHRIVARSFDESKIKHSKSNNNCIIH